MSDDTLTPEALAELERALADLSPPIGAVASDLNGYDLEQMSLPRLNDVAAILNAAPALIAAARRLGEVESMMVEVVHARVMGAQQLTAANARVAALECELALSEKNRESTQVNVGVLMRGLDEAERLEKAATQRADAAERKLAALIDATAALVEAAEDVNNYVDDRHERKRLRETVANTEAALAAAKSGGG